MNLSVAFGIVLKKHRMASEITQEQLVLSCNLDRTYIGLLERGKRQPTLTTIFTLATVLNILPSDLIKELEKLTQQKHL